MNTAQPKISIITPTFNRPLLLIRAVDSIIQQTFLSWELIIIDDSTNESTFDLREKLVEDPRIYYIRNKKNLGAAASRNRGLDAANGLWVLFLDDDDFLLSESSLLKMFEASKQHTGNWHTFISIDENNEPITQKIIEKPSYNWIKDFLFGKSFRGDATHLIKHSFIADTRFYGEYRAEWLFWYKLAEKDNFFFHNIPVKKCEYLPDGLSKTWQGSYERLFLQQQFMFVLQNFKTWKYLPIIVIRYIISFKYPNLLYKKLKAIYVET